MTTNMAPSKTKKKEDKEKDKIAPVEELEIDPEIEVEVVDDAAVEPGVGVPASAPGGPVPGRKSLGVKEPIVFKWKVVGRSDHMNVTLFKSVEREEAEAQLERLTRDGYYTHLSIMEASAKVDQPPQPKESKKSKAREKEKERQKEKEKSAKAAAEKPAAKSTPIRIPGRASDFKKSKTKATGRKPKETKAKSPKAKPLAKSKKIRKK